MTPTPQIRVIPPQALETPLNTPNVRHFTTRAIPRVSSPVASDFAAVMMGTVDSERRGVKRRIELKDEKSKMLFRNDSFTIDSPSTKRLEFRSLLPRNEDPTRSPLTNFLVSLPKAHLEYREKQKSDSDSDRSQNSSFYSNSSSEFQDKEYNNTSELEIDRLFFKTSLEPS
jgi:hypothetical protein